MTEELSDINLTDQGKIARAKKEWEQTFDAVSDLIFIVDNDHVITRVNRTMADRCGVAPVELIGKKCFEVLHGMMSAPYSCPHFGLLTCAKSLTQEFDAAKLHGIFDVTISPILDGDGRVTASVHVARDVTEKKQQAQQLAEQQARLEEINSSLELRIEKAVAELRRKDDILIHQSRLNAMGEMIGTISHQWRQPLNSIGLIVQNIQLAYKAEDLSVEELDRDIAETMKILQQIADNINGFRSFLSLDENSGPFVVNDLVSRSLSFVEPSLRNKGIRIVLDEQGDVTADGYRNEYVQAFLNIILNARDALLKQQVENALVTIRIFEENGRSAVTVSDNGGGINEDLLEKIFEPYFTTKLNGKGTGIGLYMARMIIEEKMHGRLSASNIAGGAEFRIDV